ncbi:hypothetical protein [Rothia mucilaginosa]|uniref:hypothetical protein n=1 Tax=Rothia mucilaginosa TaxID=43675 RepID=UPI0026F0BB69|nr:hypothetical protein [Rothia mucilaginosa]
MRLVAGHLLAAAGLTVGLAAELAAGATIERWLGVYFVFLVGEFLTHKNTGIHIRYSAPYQKFTPFKVLSQAKTPII